MKREIIEIIVACQIFYAGMYFQDNYVWRDGFIDGAKTVTITAFIALMGVCLLPLIIALMIVGGVYHRIIVGLHLRFLIKYVWLKHPLDYDNLEVKKAAIRSEAKKLKAKLRWYKFGDKIYIWIDKWIEKNYPTSLTS